MKQSTYASRGKIILDFFLIAIGILSASVGLKGFILPNHFTDGGITGVSILASLASNTTISFWIIIFNIPFVIMGYRQISWVFALKSAIGIIGLAIALLFIHLPVITTDKLLIAVFGGFFLGAGIGFAIRGGGVLDGTEVLALALSKRFSFSIGDIILVINLFIFSAAAFYLGMEAALYSVLTYLAASKTVDFIVQGIEEYTSVMIISPKNEEIRRGIIEVMGRGVTLLKGERGFGLHHDPSLDLKIVYCILTRLEIPKLKAIVHKLDPDAFVVIQSVNEVRGGMVKKRSYHH
ncbi:membrane protein [Bacteroidota bacterium]|nr:membrane protein [Bacteroidota bacterium]